MHCRPQPRAAESDVENRAFGKSRSAGQSDKTDPWFNDQTKVVEQRYKDLGGEITVIINGSEGRSALSVAHQTRVVDFIVGKAK